MSSSRLSNIYEKNNNNEIKICDLQRVNINTIDIYSVKKLIKKLHNKFIRHFIAMFLFFISISVMLYSSIKSSTTKIYEDVIFFIFMLLMFLWVFTYLSKQILSTRNYAYEKAQYGVVKSKYVLKSSSDGDNTENYYLNVLFLDTNTYIRNVICTYKIYATLVEGSEVLVLSFDNKTAYAIPSGSK